MNRTRSSKSEVFLLEFIFVVLFFAICAAVFAMAFVKSDSLTESNSIKNRAMIQAQSAVEIIKASDVGSEGKALEENLGAKAAPSDKADLQYYIVSYDENFMQTDEGKAVHSMSIIMETDSYNILNIQVNFDTDLFSLSAGKYLGTM